MKTIASLLVVLGATFTLNAQNENDGVFNSPNDYKHPFGKPKQNMSYSPNATYIEPEKGSGNYKQQNNAAKPLIQGIVVLTDGKVENNTNSLTNSGNYKTHH